jgi:HD superfamily phosphohydrolase
MATKVIKDPIYGYINIERIDAESIIDTASFQRLRNITQTSYSALYPSSVHNRFCHSLGVFNLGCLAFDSFKKNVAGLSKGISKITWATWENTFLFACLLHDIAHTPFSHLTEEYYDDDSSALNGLLSQITVGFKQDYKFKGKAHEKMSAIVGAKILDSKNTNYDRDLFVRSIIGEKFKATDVIENGIKNCLIELLNSKTIDVDKLDYLIRDRVMTGHESTEIDFNRLLEYVTMVFVDKKMHQEIYKNNDEEIRKYSASYYQFAFLKGALSVLESVIIARDTEKRWLQSHPTVCYDSYILQYIFQQVNEYCGNELTNIAVLSEEGKYVSKLQRNIKLLTDGDVLFMAKNFLSNKNFEQYLNRGSRLRAIWKSESEYKYLFQKASLNENLLKYFGGFVEILAQTTNESTLEISTELYEALKNKKTELSSKIKSTAEKSSIIDNQMLNTLDLQISFIETLRNFDNENFRYVFISTSQFNTGFNGDDFEKLLIHFAKDNKTRMIKDLAGIPRTEKPLQRMFYILVSPAHRDKLNKNGRKNKLIGSLIYWINKNKDKLNEEFNAHLGEQ